MNTQKLRSSIVAVLWLLPVFALQAQHQVLLNDAEVVTVSYADQAAAMSSTPDSLVMLAMPGASLGELLAMSSALNLRTYGPTGTLITGAGRGLPSDHLAVFWLGVPLNSPTLGLTDLSAVPMALFSTPQLQSGHSLSRSPGGGAAGSIHLGSEPEAMVRVGSGYDNLNNFRHWAGVSLHPTGRLKTSTRYQRDRASNRFNYHDPYLAGNPERAQEHNAFARDALIQELHVKPSAKWEIAAGAWLQRSALEVPDIMGKYGQSHAHQRDSSLRLTASVSHVRRRSTFFIRAGRFDERQHYTYRMSSTGPMLIDSRIATLRNFGSAGWIHRAQNFETEVTADVSDERAQSSHHGATGARRTLAGVQARTAWSINNLWKLRGGFRYDSGPGASMPVPELQLSRYSQSVRLFAGVRRIFRYPDLNQMFWVPGGDPSLDPEQGWSFDSGFNGKAVIGNLSVDYGANIYLQRMSSLIVWTAETGTLRARNLREVTSQGVQGQVSASLPLASLPKIGKLVFRQTIDLNVQKNDGLGDLDRRFFPMLQGRYSAAIHTPRYYMGSNIRYVTEHWMPEHLNTIRGMQDAVLLADVFVGVTFQVNRHEFRAGVMCRNVGDVLDHRISRIASPGRVVAINLEFVPNVKQHFNDKPTT